MGLKREAQSGQKKGQNYAFVLSSLEIIMQEMELEASFLPVFQISEATQASNMQARSHSEDHWSFVCFDCFITGIKICNDLVQNVERSKDAKTLFILHNNKSKNLANYFGSPVKIYTDC